MNAQRGLLLVALAAGLVAGGLYWLSAQRVPVVVAASDVAPGRALTLSDLELRQLPPDAVPAGAVTDASAAIGHYMRGPLAKGQLLLAGLLADAPAAFDGGVPVPAGQRAVAIPVDAAHALGGAVVPGSRVDVIAVPVHGRAPSDRVTELIVPSALVVDVRGEQGGSFERHPTASRSATSVRERMGSVVVAVSLPLAMRIADRSATSTFVIALVAERP
jgi:pilus assembly protein CpaB